VKICVLAGGVGGARFLVGLLRELARRDPGAQVTVVGNTGDDITLFGLRVCPDLDTVMYTLGGGADLERGWGLSGETWAAKEELAAYGEQPDWFGLGDRDLATHVVRTRLLREGVPLSRVTARLCERWSPGVTLLPMSDDTIETWVDLADGRRVHFQEWWVRLHAAVPARTITAVGADRAVPAPGVVGAIAGADVVLFPPSNPVVSIGTVLAVPGIAAAVRATAAPVVGVSPIVGGAPVRGMADACLDAIGVETSAGAVAVHYGARARAADPTATGASAGGVLDGWLVDSRDAAELARVHAAGITGRAVPLMMTDPDATAAIAAAALDLAAELAADPGPESRADLSTDRAEPA